MLSAAIYASEKRWLQESGYGLMFHYEAFKNHSSSSYNKTIDSFDVQKWANNVERTGAGHVIFVIGQHWGKYCAPNSVYEKLLGVENGEWTSKRDLIMEIGQELKKKDIKLIIYMTARAPMRYYKVIEATGDTLPSINGKPAGPKVNPMSHPRKVKGFKRSENQAPNPRFLKNWGEVCGEWSLRYGDLVSGWWFDGYKMEMKKAYEPLKKEQYNIDTWIDGVISGNPDAELAFNAGAHPSISLCTSGALNPRQTYTSGENHYFHQKTKKGLGKELTPQNFPSPDGVIWHLLLPVSKGWGAGTESKFKHEELVKHIGIIMSQGGAVTLDVPISGNGDIPEKVILTLEKAGTEIDALRSE
ncbi:MAG: alpha-L-fucosidase [Lentisphaeria bacterium]|nr:alpha-L-fucosidase [Lentisphaeria bacterium]